MVFSVKGSTSPGSVFFVQPAPLWSVGIGVFGSALWLSGGTTATHAQGSLEPVEFHIKQLVHLSDRAGLLPTPVHGADSPVSSGQPQHRPPRQTLRGGGWSEQRGVEQVPERLQGRRRGAGSSRQR